MTNIENQEPEFPKWFKPMLGTILGVPMSLSFILSLTQTFPATYAIDWITDSDGKYSLLLVVVLNFLLAMIPILMLIVVAIIIKKLFFGKKK